MAPTTHLNEEGPLLTLQQSGIPASELDEDTLRQLQDESNGVRGRVSICSDSIEGDQIHDTIDKATDKNQAVKEEEKKDEKKEDGMKLWHWVLLAGFFVADSFKPPLEKLGGGTYNINPSILSGSINVMNIIIGAIGLIYVCGTKESIKLMGDVEALSGYFIPGMLFAISQCLNLVQNQFLLGKTRKAFAQLRIPVTALCASSLMGKRYTNLQWFMMSIIVAAVFGFILCTEKSDKPIGGSGVEMMIGLIFSILGTASACLASVAGEKHMKANKHLSIFVQRVHFEFCTLLGCILLILVANPIFGMISDFMINTFKPSEDGKILDKNFRDACIKGVGNQAFYAVNDNIWSDITWKQNENSQLFPNKFGHEDMSFIDCSNIQLGDISKDANGRIKDPSSAIFQALSRKDTKASEASKKRGAIEDAIANYISTKDLTYIERQKIVSSNFPNSSNTAGKHPISQFRKVGDMLYNSKWLNAVPYQFKKDSAWTKQFVENFSLHMVEVDEKSVAADKNNIFKDSVVHDHRKTYYCTGPTNCEDLATKKKLVLADLTGAAVVSEIKDGNAKILRLGQPSTVLPKHDILKAAKGSNDNQYKSKATDLTLTDTNSIRIEHARELTYTPKVSEASGASIEIKFKRTVTNTKSSYSADPDRNYDLSLFNNAENINLSSLDSKKRFIDLSNTSVTAPYTDHSEDDGDVYMVNGKDTFKQIDVDLLSDQGNFDFKLKRHKTYAYSHKTANASPRENMVFNRATAVSTYNAAQTFENFESLWKMNRELHLYDSMFADKHIRDNEYIRRQINICGLEEVEKLWRSDITGDEEVTLPMKLAGQDVEIIVKNPEDPYTTDYSHYYNPSKLISNKSSVKRSIIQQIGDNTLRANMLKYVEMVYHDYVDGLVSDKKLSGIEFTYNIAERYGNFGTGTNREEVDKVTKMELKENYTGRKEFKDNTIAEVIKRLDQILPLVKSQYGLGPGSAISRDLKLAPLKSITYFHKVKYICDDNLHFKERDADISNKHSRMIMCSLEGEPKKLFSNAMTFDNDSDDINVKYAAGLLQATEPPKKILMFSRPSALNQNACSSALCRNASGPYDGENKEDKSDHRNIVRNGFTPDMHANQIQIPFYKSNSSFSPRKKGMLYPHDPFYYSIYQGPRFNLSSLAPVESMTHWFFLAAITNAAQGWFSMVVSRELSTLVKNLVAATTLVGCAVADWIFSPPADRETFYWLNLFIASFVVIGSVLLFALLPGAPGEKKH